MIYLYNLIVYLSSILIFIGSFFSKKLNQLHNGRKKIKKYLKTIKITNEEKIWIHVSSVGEFEQAKSIIYSYFSAKTGRYSWVNISCSENLSSIFYQPNNSVEGRWLSPKPGRRKGTSLEVKERFCR